MNILLINHYAGSVHHGMEFRPYYMAREWTKCGESVQVVAASYSHVRAKQPDLGDKPNLDESIDGINYRWYRTPSYLTNGFGRIRNMLAFLWAAWRDAPRLAREFRPNVVIASSTYPMDMWPARRVARLAGARLVYEVHDLWPLSPMELGGMSRWHPFIIWVQIAEDYAYRVADVVVSMLPKTRDYMVSRGMSPLKWHYVPNGVEESEWEAPASLPAEVLGALQRVRKLGLPVVGYAGTHGLANSLDTLLDAAKLLEGEISIVLVGTGPERERLLRRVDAESISNVTMLPSVQKVCIPKLLELFDIAYIGLLPEKLFRFGISPNKLIDYMMARKPVVMSIAAGNDPVTESGCGITVAPSDPEAVSEAILKIAQLPIMERVRMGERGRSFVMKEHIYPVLAQRFMGAVANG